LYVFELVGLHLSPDTAECSMSQSNKGKLMRDCCRDSKEQSRLVVVVVVVVVVVIVVVVVVVVVGVVVGVAQALLTIVQIALTIFLLYLKNNNNHRVQNDKVGVNETKAVIRLACVRGNAGSHTNKW
jgi:Flp pilus assembly protein TadB